VIVGRLLASVKLGGWFVKLSCCWLRIFLLPKQTYSYRYDNNTTAASKQNFRSDFRERERGSACNSIRDVHLNWCAHEL
jgi:hypothetical protein